MGRGNSYPPELLERAVPMVAGVRPHYPSDWPAIKAVSAKLGIGSAEMPPSPRSAGQQPESPDSSGRFTETVGARRV